MQFDTLFHTLTEKFGGEWVMVCRFHYLVADMVDWEQLETDYPKSLSMETDMRIWRNICCVAIF